MLEESGKSLGLAQVENFEAVLMAAVKAEDGNRKKEMIDGFFRGYNEDG